MKDAISAAVRAVATTTDAAAAAEPASAAAGAPASTEALAAARAEGNAEGHAAGARAGAGAERTRIKGILGSQHAEGRRGLAEHMAFDTDMSIAAAESMLQASAKETAAASTSRLDRVMAGAQVPHVGATPAPGDAAPRKTLSTADIYAARAAAARPVSR